MRKQTRKIGTSSSSSAHRLLVSVCMSVLISFGECVCMCLLRTSRQIQMSPNEQVFGENESERDEEWSSVCLLRLPIFLSHSLTAKSAHWWYLLEPVKLLLFRQGHGDNSNERIRRENLNSPDWMTGGPGERYKDTAPFNVLLFCLLVIRKKCVQDKLEFTSFFP